MLPRKSHWWWEILSLVWLVFFVSPAVAEGPLRVALVSANTSIQPGRAFYVGLSLEHREGYHSYWKFPGIVGVPTAMKWKLPPGWKAGEIEWPAPERVWMFKIQAQGFYGKKLLPILLTPPADLRAGDRISLQGKAIWMCCGRDCNPGFEDLSLELPVSLEPTVPDPAWSARFADAQPARPSLDWETRASLHGEVLSLEIRAKSEVAKSQLAGIEAVLFFTEDGLTDLNEEQTLEKTGQGLVLRQPLSKFAPKPLPERVVGVLQGPGAKSIQIDVPLERQ